MKKLLLIINFPRTILMYLCVKNSTIFSIIMEDLKRFSYGDRTHSSKFLTFSDVIIVDRCFRNLLFYRLKKESLLKAIILNILFPKKKDMEIGCINDIGGGFVCYHGHGTTIHANSIGSNFSVWQGVTIGRNPKNGEKIDKPTIGDNVSIYTNAVVAGNIVIGDNVKIGAGSVVMKNIPSNSIVIGNPCIIKTNKDICKK